MQKNKRYKIVNIVFCILASVLLAGALAFFVVASVKNIPKLYIGACVLSGFAVFLTIAYVIFVNSKWRV